MSAFRFLLTVAIAYSVMWIFSGLIPLLFPDALESYIKIVRPEGAFLGLIYISRLIQVIAIVALYNYFIARKDIQTGMWVGFIFGIFGAGGVVSNYAFLPIDFMACAISSSTYLIVSILIGGISGYMYRKG